MNLVLTRNHNGPDGIYAVLTSVYGDFVAATLEHAYPIFSSFEPKIPRGSFTCVRGQHALHNGIPFETFEITGVPGHQGLLFHAGNFNADSEGCILLGRAHVGNMVTESRATFRKFMELQSGADKFNLEVV